MLKLTHNDPGCGNLNQESSEETAGAVAAGSGAGTGAAGVLVPGAIGRRSTKRAVCMAHHRLLGNQRVRHKNPAVAPRCCILAPQVGRKPGKVGIVRVFPGGGFQGLVPVPTAVLEASRSHAVAAI